MRRSDREPIKLNIQKRWFMKMEGCALTVAGGDIFGCLLGELPQAAANFPLNVLETRKGVEARRERGLGEGTSARRSWLRTAGWRPTRRVKP